MIATGIDPAVLDVGGARVLNMVAIVDRDRFEEVETRLAQVGRYHPSRTILCVVERGRTTVDAGALPGRAGQPVGVAGPSRDQVVIEMGPKHLAHLDVIVDSILISDLMTVVWSPHGNPVAVDSLLRLANVILLDSAEADIAASLARVRELSDRAYIVDLSWLRSTPWRERIAATFDPPMWRGALDDISSVAVRHRADSVAAALLFIGWLCSRLGWQPAGMVRDNGSLRGGARGPHGEVELALQPVDTLGVPGLDGVTVDTAGGSSISLDRGPGGLAASRRTPDGRTSEWTVLGASRGEGGILGEGVRQALLRDPTYRPALVAAQTLLP
jgi:glucose-6-phosphate dehydrogenase assembly protein OpcA